MHGRAGLHFDLAEDGQRNRAHAPVGAGLLGGAGLEGVHIVHGHALVVLGNLGDLGVVADGRTQITRHGLGQHVHAALGLEDGAVELIHIAGAHLAPQVGLQQIMQAHRGGGLGLRHQAAAGVNVVAPEVADGVA